MARKILTTSIIFLFLIMPFISGSCDDNQININTASLEGLDEIIWVGPATAEKIINTRPFDSVDSLIDVSGIGEVKLSDIKTQGLVCVDETQETDSVQVENLLGEDNEQEANLISKREEDLPINLNLKPIKLNSKDIKSENNKEELDKNKYAIYGFIGFCLLLCFLFVIRKKDYKTEFENDGE